MKHLYDTKIYRYATLNDLNHGAAEFITALSRKSIIDHGLFTLALSGGNTPRSLYNYLTMPPFKEKIPWKNLHVFWGDERCVPPDHIRSNYFMAYRAFIVKTTLPPENIHRIETEKLLPEQSAQLYEQEIRKFFGLPEEGFPRFDLILLGIGKDGHTASLFPGADSLSEKKNWVVSIRAPGRISPRNRITLTLPVINHADRVVFLVCGEEKREIFEKIIHDQTAVKKIPAAMVSPRKELIWFVCF